MSSSLKTKKPRKKAPLEKPREDLEKLFTEDMRNYISNCYGELSFKGLLSNLKKEFEIDNLTSIDIFWCVRNILKLPMPLPDGFEYINSAAEERGFDRNSFTIIVDFYDQYCKNEGSIRAAYMYPRRGVSKNAKRQMISTADANDAVELWFTTENIREAARRYSFNEVLLRKRLDKAKVKIYNLATTGKDCLMPRNRVLMSETDRAMTKFPIQFRCTKPTANSLEKGEKVGMLTYNGEHIVSGRTLKFYCDCDCGTKNFPVLYHRFKIAHIKSCGCLSRKLKKSTTKRKKVKANG